MMLIHTWEAFNETFEARASEWASSLLLICCALVAIFNEGIFSYSQYLITLSEWMPRYLWATLFLGVGSARFIMLLINGAWWRTPLFRCLFAFLSAGIYFQLALAVLPNLGLLLVFAGWAFLLDTYNALRAGREAGMAQFIQKQKKTQDRERARRNVSKSKL